MNEVQTKLMKLYACEKAVRWAGNYGTLAEAWEACVRGDWMLWLAATLQIERTLLVKAACGCARLALPYTTDQRPLKVIVAVERWASGDSPENSNALCEYATATEAAVVAEEMVANSSTARAVANAAHTTDPLAEASLIALFAHDTAVAAGDAAYGFVYFYAAADTYETAHAAGSEARAATLLACAVVVRNVISESAITEAWGR